MRYMVNGVETDTAPRNEQCDYRGEMACHWTAHSEAVADVRAWENRPGQDLHMDSL